MDTRRRATLSKATTATRTKRRVQGQGQYGNILNARICDVYCQPRTHMTVSLLMDQSDLMAAGGIYRDRGWLSPRTRASPASLTKGDKLAPMQWQSDHETHVGLDSEWQNGGACDCARGDCPRGRERSAGCARSSGRDGDRDLSSCLVWG